jgi:hypothetical protein
VFVLSTAGGGGGGGGGPEYKLGTKTDNTILIQAEDSGDSMQKGRRSWRQLP